MSRPENVVISTIDNAAAAQQEARDAARRLIDSLPRNAAKDLEVIIRATNRTKEYLKELRQLEHQRKARP
jgi:ABC-type transporter Mla subunit MlaD